MLRIVAPHNRFTGLHDRITDALARRIEHSPSGLIETRSGSTTAARAARTTRSSRPGRGRFARAGSILAPG
jgi:hypothetical protein